MDSFTEALILFIIFSIVSIGASFFYLYSHINKIKISLILFIAGLIYFSLYSFLHFIVIFDLSLCNEESIKEKGIDIVFSFIRYYYHVFNYVNMALNYVICPLCINYLKTGYFSKCKIICDTFFHNYVKLIIYATLAVIAIIIYFIFQQKINELYGKYGYWKNVSNYLGILEIYKNIGFFIVEIFKDSRRQLYKNIEKKYYKLLKMKLEIKNLIIK